MRDAYPGASIRRGNSRTAKTLLVGLAAALALDLADPPCTAHAQQSYSDYYNKALIQTGGGLGTNSANRYLYDKYFYHSAPVSPYINIDRPDPFGSTSYQAYVKPELQRRQAALNRQSAYLQQRKLQGNIGDTRYPGAGFVGGTAANAWLKPVPAVKTTPSAYYNHWYGGWSKR